jgi:hypothetical protein
LHFLTVGILRQGSLLDVVQGTAESEVATVVKDASRAVWEKEATRT